MTPLKPAIKNMKVSNDPSTVKPAKSTTEKEKKIEINASTTKDKDNLLSPTNVLTTNTNTISCRKLVKSPRISD